MHACVCVCVCAAVHLGARKIVNLTAAATAATAMQVGMFPDVCEALVLGHLARGDKVRQ